ncbi:zinc finger BED domain-containing protein 1-like [Rhizophagus irregularis DAOM 181602=DAOM 197198]|nr:zinc finger BED domain-containing protein 1-like [Rhizophagus irregularis DAOM 181602=DAOM 197198]
MIKLLEPFETITRRLSGGKFLTLNMVHPYMCMLKRMFAPRANENETVESYLELIYGPLIPENEEENAEDNISDSSSVRREQGRGRGRGLGRGRGRGCGHSHGGHGHILQRPNNEVEDINQVEYLPPVNNLEGILKKVRAAIYLSLETHWNVPSELSLVATILDPRMKSFLYVEDLHREEQKTQAESLLSNLYTQLKHDLELPEEVRSPILDDDDDIFERMWASNQQLTQTGNNDNNEIMCYLRCPDEPKSTDPLVWWRDHRSSYPILSKLAQKYLSIPSTSVPSERLFSDAGNHVSAKRTRLAPDLVDRILFLKRNSTYFPIFPPLENK